MKQLQNTILHTDVPSEATLPEDRRRPIHISTLQIPAEYEAILEIVPGLHARPPLLPESLPLDGLPPPKTSYDFMLHIGLAGRGPLRLEKVGHKLGYHMKDATGKLAALVRSTPKDFSRRDNGDALTFVAESAERERLGMDSMETQTSVGGDSIVRATRGFGPAYETFSDEITTDIDVTRLVQKLRQTGVEVSVLHSIDQRQLIVFLFLSFRKQQIYTSMDAGHHLCDFIYYCSLAEAKRTSKPYEKRRNTQVLFLHCPPVDQPLSTQQVIDAIKRIVVWVCGEQQLVEDSEVAAGH